MGYTLNLDEAAFRKLNEESGLVGKGVAKAAGRVRDDAKGIIKSDGRVDTGALLQSVVSQKVQSTSGGVIYRVGSDLEYARYQHEGVEGPIVPRRAKVLRFKPSGSNSYVFTQKVSGFEGIYFLTRALDQASSKDFAA